MNGCTGCTELAATVAELQRDVAILRVEVLLRDRERQAELDSTADAAATALEYLQAHLEAHRLAGRPPAPVDSAQDHPSTGDVAAQQPRHLHPVPQHPRNGTGPHSARDRGALLVEVLIAIVLVGLVLVPTSGLVVMVLRATAATQAAVDTQHAQRNVAALVQAVDAPPEPCVATGWQPLLDTAPLGGWTATATAVDCTTHPGVLHLQVQLAPPSPSTATATTGVYTRALEQL